MTPGAPLFARKGWSVRIVLDGDRQFQKAGLPREPDS
jgi:hypothetical protein